MTLIKAGVNPIQFDDLHIARTADESKLINEDPTPKVIISAMEADDIVVTVDFAGAEIGTVNRKVTITLSPEFSSCGALGNYSVYATVMEAEEVEEVE